MKKTLIASAIAASLLMGAVQAETVLYGSIRFDYQNSKNEFEGEKSDRVSNLTDQGSRIGLKGGEDIGNGIQVIYHLEWGFDGMEGGSDGNGFHNRLAYIGLATEFGTFVAGRLDNPFKGTLVDGSVTDDFNTFDQTASMRAVTSQFLGGVDHTFGGLADIDPKDPTKGQYITSKGFNFLETDEFGDYSDFGYGLDRVSNAIAYLSPNWNGFSFNAAIIMDDNKDFAYYQKKKNLDVFTINAMYEHESGLYGKIGYIQGYTAGNLAYSSHDKSVINTPFVIGENRKTRAFGGQIGYRTEQIGLSLSYADAKLSNVDSYYRANPTDDLERFSRKDKAQGWDIGASYSFGDNYASTVRIAYGETRYTGESTYYSGGAVVADNAFASSRIKPKDKIWAVGFEQKLSERTRVWAEYQNIKQSGDSTALYNSGKVDAKNNYGKANYNAKNDTFAIGIRHDF